MNRKFAFAFLAFASLFSMFQSSANAEELECGTKISFTNMGGRIVVVLEREDDMKEGVYYVKLVEGGSQGFNEDGNWGYLTAESSDAGATVNTNGESAETKWALVDNGNGWNFLHADNGANALTHFPGALKLKRNNDGGRGNKDQLWVIE
jgi:hypothetical protein